MRYFVAGAISLAFASTSAVAAPDCWGLIVQGSPGLKVARITCSDDAAPGTAASYTCSFKWKVKGKSGFVETWSGQFVSARGDKNVVRYENGNLSDGSKLDDEVDGMSMSCSAK